MIKEATLGRKLKRHELIHHKREVAAGGNNTPQNIRVTTFKKHNLHHRHAAR